MEHNVTIDVVPDPERGGSAIARAICSCGWSAAQTYRRPKGATAARSIVSTKATSHIMEGASE